MTVRYDPIVRSFNAGELTEMVAERSDLEKYHSGCSVLENMIVTPHGPAQKMPGSYYVGKVKDSRSRLIPFQYNTTDTLILEMGPGYVRMFRDKRHVLLNGKCVVWAAGTQYSEGNVMHDPDGGAPYLCAVSHVSSDDFDNDSDFWYQQDYLLSLTQFDPTAAGTAESGCTRIQVSTSDPNYWFAYSRVRPGDWVYCQFDSDYTDGFYMVLAVDPQFNRWIDIAMTYSSEVAVNTASPVIFQFPIGIHTPKYIHYTQSNDVLYMAHPKYPPSKLMRFSDFVWKHQDLELDDGPFGLAPTKISVTGGYVCPNGADAVRIVKAGKYKGLSVGQTVEIKYTESASSVLLDGPASITAIDSTISNYLQVSATGAKAAIGTTGMSVITGAATLTDNGSDKIRFSAAGIGATLSAGDRVDLRIKNLNEKPVLFSADSAAVYTVNPNTPGKNPVVAFYYESSNILSKFVRENSVRVEFPQHNHLNGIYEIIGIGTGRFSINLVWPENDFGNQIPIADIATSTIKVRIFYPYYNGSYLVTAVDSSNAWVDVDCPFRGPTTWHTGQNAHRISKINNSALLTQIEDDATVSNNGSGKVRITVNEMASEMVVGSLLYFDFAATYSDEWYEITAIDETAKTIDLGGLSYSSGTTVDVYKSRIAASVKSPTSLKFSATSGFISVEASSGVFSSRDVGRLLAIDQYRQASGGNVQVTVVPSATANSTELLVTESWEVTSNSAANSVWTMSLERKTDPWSPWEVIRTWSRDNANILDSGDEEEESAYYRLVVSSVATANCKATLSSRGNRIRGVIRITEYVNDQQVNGVVLRTLYATTGTTNWKFGEFSARSGYPKSVTFHEDRLCFAGTESSPNTVWRSRVGDYENFREGPNDDDAQIIELNTSTNDEIQWILGKGALFIGTAGGEHAIRGANGEPTTMTNIRKDDLSNYGSRDIQPQLAGDAILAVQRQGKKIREIVYSYEAETSFSSGYVANDLSILAPQVVESGIVKMAYMMTPFPVLWCVCGDGTIAGMSYERAQRVAAWHRHTTDGKYLDAAVVAGPDEDELWVLVERDAGTFIERFASFVMSDSIKDQYFVHCGIKLDYGDAVTCSITVSTNYVKITPSSLPMSADGVQMMNDQGCWIAIRGLPTYLAELDFDQSGNIFQLGNADGDGYRLNVLSTNPEGAEYDPDGSLPTGVADGTQTMEWVTPTAPNLPGLSDRVELIDGKRSDEISGSSSTYFTLGVSGNVVVAGLPYAATVAPMPFNVDYSGGTTRNKQRRVVALAASLFRSGKCKVGYDLNKLEYVKMEGETVADDELVTGLARKNIGGEFTKDPVLYVVSDEPRQCVVRAIVPQFEIGTD